jgi:hypothetical protein
MNRAVDLDRRNATEPRMNRAEKAEPYRDQILEAFDRCRGNLVRVHEASVDTQNRQLIDTSKPAIN